MKKGYRYSEETRKKMLGRKHSPEHIEKVAQAHRGTHPNKESRIKMSLAQIGRKHSKETKNKIGLANKGRVFSLETRKKMSDFRKGTHHSLETIEKMRNIKRGKKFSKETREKIGFIHRGSKSHLWKGGVTPINFKIRNSLDYTLWRESVFIRDNYICQKYKISGGKLVAHHIQNFAQYPELRFAIDNGITLSKKAHKEFHKKYGKKNNTKEQLLEFLKNI